MTKYEELNLLRSWEADARERAELLAQHLKAVLEVAYTWQPDYATKMDMDTLAFAATEVGFEPSNVAGNRLAEGKSALTGLLGGTTRSEKE